MNIGIEALAASGVFSGGTLPATADMSKGGDGRYILPVKFGLGGVPLGNEFEVVAIKIRCFAVVRAWACGTALWQLPPQ